MLEKNPATLGFFVVVTVVMEEILNKVTTLLNLQNIFRYCHVIFICKWAFNSCTFEFYIKVRFKIMRQNLLYNLNMKYGENRNSTPITRTIK